MGFFKVSCPTCKKEFRYPLSQGYVGFYWFLLVANALWIAVVLSQGNMIVPNPIGVVVLTFVVISLVKNSRLKREISGLKKTLPGE